MQTRELVIVATHNTNNNILRQLGYVPPDVLVFESLFLVNDKLLKESEAEALPAVVDCLQKKLKVCNPKLITLLVDFNLGYTGKNVSPLKELVDLIKNSPAVKSQFDDGNDILKKYCFIKTASELAAIDDKLELPFRIITTGSGGDDVLEEQEKLERMTSRAGMEAYSFEKNELMKYLTTTVRPYKVATPQSSSRTISSGSSTSTSGIQSQLRRDTSVSTKSDSSPSPQLSPTSSDLTPIF